MRTKYFCVVLFLLTSPAFPQGSLTPPGPPAASMRTLDQIEPRRPLGPLFTPGDANYHFVISQPGSYYLPARIAVSLPNGIHITAPGVTLDLQGFDITRQAGSGGDAITVSGAAHRCTIKNGTITGGFANGVNAVDFARAGTYRELAVSECSGTALTAGPAWLIEQCKAYDNSGSGIFAGAGSMLRGCTAENNRGDYGITASDSCILSNCTVSLTNGIYGIIAGLRNTLSHCTSEDNTVTYGIYAGVGSTLSHCTAGSNDSDATNSYGIYGNGRNAITACTSTTNLNSGSSPTRGIGIFANDGSTVRDCVAGFNKGTGILTGNSVTLIGNTSQANGTGAGDGINTGVSCLVSNSTAYDNNGDGIAVSHGSTVSDCLAQSNSGDGIQATIGCLITRNNCRANGDGTGVTNGAGIHIPGGNSDSRVEDNNCVSNDIGIFVEGTFNLIVKNKCTINIGGGNFSITGTNNFVGTVTTSAATMNTDKNPHANLDF